MAPPELQTAGAAENAPVIVRNDVPEAAPARAKPIDLGPETVASEAKPQYTTSQPQALALTDPENSSGEPQAANGEPLADQPVIPPEPELGDSRDEGVRDIRTKGEASGKVKPNVFTTRQPQAQPIPKNVQERLKADLAAAAAENQSEFGADIDAANEELRKRLQRRAATHYKDALSSIEK